MKEAKFNLTIETKLKKKGVKNPEPIKSIEPLSKCIGSIKMAKQKKYDMALSYAEGELSMFILIYHGEEYDKKYTGELIRDDKPQQCESNNNNK